MDFGFKPPIRVINKSVNNTQFSNWFLYQCHLTQLNSYLSYVSLTLEKLIKNHVKHVLKTFKQSLCFLQVFIIKKKSIK